MKLSIRICIFSLTLLYAGLSHAQSNGEIRIHLETKTGNGPFAPFLNSTELNDSNDINFNPARKFTGIPKDLAEMIIKQLDFQPEQGIYELYLRLQGQMKPEMLMKALSKYHADTLQLSRSPIKHLVFFVSGRNNKGKRVIITDTNNNLDFSDEKVYEYDTATSKGFPENLPSQTVHYQYAYNGKVYERTFHLKASPFPSYYSYRNPVEERLYLVGMQNEYREGFFILDNKTYKIQAATNNQPRFVYKPSNTSIQVQLPGNKEPAAYTVGDTLTFHNRRYLFSGISVFGDTLRLSYVGRGTVIYGTDSGKIAYNITAKDLSGQPFNLDQLKGKYVLIDFWGTWCKPCISAIPDLVRISQRFKDKVQVVSVAYDNPENMDALKAMIKTSGMNWIHLFQEMSNPDKKPIIDQYKVKAYPTQILIDPEGKILSRTSSADKGVYIEKKLSTLIKN